MTTEKNIVARISDYLNTFMVFPNPDQAMACALWVLATWTFSDSFPERPYTTPYLYVSSDGPRSGKTLLIDLLEPIVLNPERTINMTSAAMFRLIEKVAPAMFIDEVDTVFDGSKHSDLQNVINGGYKLSGYVWRTVPGPDGPEPTKFRTFCPKLLAGIANDKLPDTVLSRCIPIELIRVATLSDEGEILAPDGSTREIYYAHVVEPLATQLVREIQAFMADWSAEFERYMPKPIPGINPRAWEITYPLVQIARRAGIETEVREMLSRLMAPKPEKEAPEVQMLRNIRAAFEASEADRMFSADIAAAAGEGLTAKLLSRRYAHLIEGSSTNITVGNRRGRGYYRQQFEGAFARYL